MKYLLWILLLWMYGIRKSFQSTLKGDETCNDLAEWCPSYKVYCKESYVFHNCPMTCGRCSLCFDNKNKEYCQLAKEKNMCSNKDRFDYFKENCAETCNFCSKSPCQDLAAMCPYYYKPFCSYPAVQKFCKKTCDLCAVVKCGIAKQRSKKGTSGIVGGTTAGKGFFPWQVAIYYNNVFMCGGTLVDTKHILTAAHCFNGRSKDVTQYKAVLGEHNRKYDEGTEQSRTISKISIHEQYQDSSDAHDIALVQMETKVHLNDHVTTACLPTVGTKVQVGTECYITGWGKTQHDGKAVDILQKVKVPIASTSKCEERNTFNFHRVTEKMICTGFDDGSTFSSGCHGDSGGPLSCENNGVWTVQGVVSWGSPLCNGLDRYTVFTRVNSYKTWIQKNLS